MRPILLLYVASMAALPACAVGGQRPPGMAATDGAPGGSRPALVSRSDRYAERLSLLVRTRLDTTRRAHAVWPAEVTILAAQDGRIERAWLSHPSGSSEWDDAVLKAVAQVKKFPPDVDGTVPRKIVLNFLPE